MKEEPPSPVLPEDPKYIEWMEMKKNAFFQMKFADKNLTFSFLYNPKRIRCAMDTVLLGVVTAPESFKLRKWVRNTWSRNADKVVDCGALS
uniref:Hexosyltransferase n=1 Tax=Panagrolaimus sp. JU765 TaxID=591449 RepID=A0AC34Q1J1_9BILA